MQKRVLQISICIGIFLIFSGFILQVLPTAEIQANDVKLAPYSYSINELELSDDFTSASYSLQLTFNKFPGDFENFSYEFGQWDEVSPYTNNSYLINDTESLDITEFYSTYVSDQNFSFIRVNGEFEEYGTYYLLLINNNPIEMTIYYTLSIFSQYYTIGILIMLLGAVFCAVGLYFQLQGWKRYMILGISINSALFACRMLLLPYFENLNAFSISFLDLELYDDFSGYYLPWSLDFANGLWPYSADVPSYIYSPLFYIMVGITGFIPLASWIVAFPIFLCNMGTGYLIFRILLNQSQNEKVAQTALLYYYLNPFILIYGSFMWFNPPPFVFWVILGYFLMQKGRYNAAMFTFGIGVMFKQFAIIFLSIALIYVFKCIQHEQYKAQILILFKAICFWLLPVMLISLPFLIHDAPGYISRMLSKNLDFSLNHLIGIHFFDNEPVSFVSFFKLLGSPVWLLNGLAWLILTYIPFIIWSGLMLFYDLKFSSNTKLFQQEKIPGNSQKLLYNAILFGLLLAIGIQLFYPRGVYKYYMILFVPLMVMLYHPKNNIIKSSDSPPQSFATQLFIGFFLSWLVFYINRYVYLIVLLVWAFYLIYQFMKEEKSA
jgi:hypothetical protein